MSDVLTTTLFIFKVNSSYSQIFHRGKSAAENPVCFRNIEYYEKLSFANKTGTGFIHFFIKARERDGAALSVIHGHSIVHSQSHN